MPSRWGVDMADKDRYVDVASCTPTGRHWSYDGVRGSGWGMGVCCACVSAGHPREYSCGMNPLPIALLSFVGLTESKNRTCQESGRGLVVRWVQGWSAARSRAGGCGAAGAGGARPRKALKAVLGVSCCPGPWGTCQLRGNCWAGQPRLRRVFTPCSFCSGSAAGRPLIRAPEADSAGPAPLRLSTLFHRSPCLDHGRQLSP